MKLTKLEVIRLWNAIESCKEHKNTKFIYATLRTKKVLETEVEVLTALSTPSKKFKEYQQERIALCNKHAKVKDGKPVTENGEFVFSVSGQKMFKASLSKLKKRFSDWIDERDAQMEDYNKILKEGIELDIHQVNLMYVPEDLNASILSGLLPLIMEE